MPPFPIVWTARALRDARRAEDWWDEHRPLAPDLFRSALVSTINLIADHPEVGLRIPDRDARRMLLSGTGYAVYYRFRTVRQRIEIVALWHAKRGTKPRF